MIMDRMAIIKRKKKNEKKQKHDDKDIREWYALKSPEFDFKCELNEFF